MKKILSSIVALSIIILGGYTISAESKYDFIEHDVETKETKTISYNELDGSNIPEKTNPRKPISSRTVIGDDDREVVADTTKFPYSSVVKITIKGSDGNSYRCSGALISANMMLTAAHCLMEDGDDGQILRYGFQAYPGSQNYVNPFGVAYATKYYISKKYYDSRYGSSEHDIAMVKLDRNIGNQAGWLGLDYNPDKEDLFTLSGYGGPQEFLNTMRTETKNIPLKISDGRYSWNEDIVWHVHDSMGGNSGGAIHDSQYRIAMVHTAGVVDYNMAVRINEARYKMIYSIMNLDVPVEKIEVSPKEANIEINEKINLVTTISPDNATNKNVVYTSSNEMIASVSSTGEVTGISAGEVTITVRSEDGNQVATVKITVKEQTGWLNIILVDSKNNKKPLGNAVFELRNSNGEVVATDVKTSIFGEAEIYDLAIGEYTLVQTKAPDGYRISPSQKISIYKDYPTTVRLTNRAVAE